MSRHRRPNEPEQRQSVWGKAPASSDAQSEPQRTTRTEMRIYGFNACRAAYSRAPQSIRKLWLLQDRLSEFRDVVSHFVANRLGYSVVEEDDLVKLSGSRHHQGVVMDIERIPEISVSRWLQTISDRNTGLALWLDGVGNPHNFGAILRVAGHFGAAILLPKTAELALSPAAIRVAEGAAHTVPIIRLGRDDNSVAQLRSAGFRFFATSVREGRSAFSTSLPAHSVIILGSEGQGMNPALSDSSDELICIPGTGEIESLNVASACSVLCALWARENF